MATNQAGRCSGDLKAWVRALARSDIGGNLLFQLGYSDLRFRGNCHEVDYGTAGARTMKLDSGKGDRASGKGSTNSARLTAASLAVHTTVSVRSVQPDC